MTPVVGPDLPERVITVKLTQADLNVALERVDLAQIRFHSGTLTLTKDTPLLTVSARIHPDMGPGRLRLAIPFAEIRGLRGAGWLVRKTLNWVWNWLDGKLEDFISNQLAAHGLPWDLVWVDSYRDAAGSKVATVNISPVVLNDYLARQGLPGLDGLALRLAGIDVEPHSLSLRVQLVPRQVATGAADASF